MNLYETIRSITYLKSNTADLVRDAHDGAEPLIVTQNGEAKAVLMGVQQYDQWKRSLTMLKLLALSEADQRAGRVHEQDDVFVEARGVIDGLRTDD